MIAAIIIGVVALVGFALYKSPALRAAIGIKFGNAVDSATTEIEKEEHEYEKLKAKIPQLRNNIAGVMAKAATDGKAVDAAQQKVVDIEKKAKSPVFANASDEAKKALGLQYTEAKEEVVDAEKRLAISQKNADDAQKQLDGALKSLGKFSKQISRDKADNQLADAIKYNADVKQELSDFNDKLSVAGKASGKIQEKLEQAKALDQLASGSKVDQELAAMEDSQKAADGLSELEALMGSANKSKSAQ